MRKINVLRKAACARTSVTACARTCDAVHSAVRSGALMILQFHTRSMSMSISILIFHPLRQEDHRNLRFLRHPPIHRHHGMPASMLCLWWLSAFCLCGCMGGCCPGQTNDRVISRCS